MAADQALKQLLQLCADMQDGFFQAATEVENLQLAQLLQTGATDWNAFADQIFPILLATDHTSPDAKWKADPGRAWMNAVKNGGAWADDLAVCDECLHGLTLARGALQQAQLGTLPQVGRLVQQQQAQVDKQMSALVRFVEDGDRRPA